MSNFVVERFRDIGSSLVEDNRYIVPLIHEFGVSSLDQIPVTFLRFNHEQKFIHEGGHSPRLAGGGERRHVEDDIIEIARLEVGHEVKELLKSQLRWTGLRGSYFGEIEIVGCGIDRFGGFQRGSERVGWLAFEKGMNVAGTKIHVDEEDLAIIGLGEGGGEPSRQRGCACSRRKTGDADKLRLVRELVKLKVETDPIPDRLTILPDKMTSVPRRQISPFHRKGGAVSTFTGR